MEYEVSNIMGAPSYMWCVVDHGVVIRRMTAVNEVSPIRLLGTAVLTA